MPRRKEEESDEEEEESEEEESGSDDEGSDDDSDEGSDDEDGSEEEDSDEGSEDGSDEESEEEDETPRSTSKKKSKNSNNNGDGLLNISLTIDKENGKVISSKVEEKQKENTSSSQPTPIETSTAMTQTDYNMFFPPLSEALYQASTSSQKRDELLNQAKRILLAPDNSRNARYNNSPQIPSYQQPIYKPVSSPYPPMFDQQGSRGPQYSQSSYQMPPRRDPYSYSGSSSFKPVGPQSSPTYYYDQQQLSHPYKHYPPPPRQYQSSPSEYSTNQGVRFQTESSRHYYDRNAPSSSSFKPINEMDNYTLNNSPSPSNFSEDNRYGRYINPKFM